MEENKMKLMKKGIAIVLAAAMVVTAAPANNAEAAKKPSIAKKTSVKVGKSVVIKVKNATKKTTVKWSTSNKKVAKIVKKGTVTKGKKACANVKGVKKGTAVIKATIKVGKKKITSKCTVTVGKKTPVATNAPVASNAPAGTTNAPTSASAAPSASAAATNTAAPTEDPNQTPKPTKTPEPTQMPADNLEFDAVSGGAIKLDNSSYTVTSGNSKYMADKDYVEVNDPDQETLGMWSMPEGVTIKDGDIVSFRVQGIFKGDKTIRFWIGDGGNGGCTPIKLVNTVEEGSAIEDGKYPACYKPSEANAEELVEMVGASGSATAAEGVVRKDQMLLGADASTGKFDVSFNFKAGTSQNDTKSDYSKFTLKAVIGQNINGLIVKNIYITKINGEDVGSSDDNTGDDDNQNTGDDDNQNTDEVSGQALTVDLSTAAKAEGNGAYDTAAKKLVINDSAGSSQVFVNLPETYTEVGTKVEVNVKGTYTGDTGFRVWIGNGFDSGAVAKVFAADFKNGAFDETSQ